jgi:Zn-finger nucleic acid-binding protein
MLCPNCKEPLLVLEFDGIEVDYCDDCRGVWLDPEELELLFGDSAWKEALRPAPGENLRKEREKRCPRCRKPMHKRAAGAQAPVTTDLCPRGHGVWLDAGELHALIAQAAKAPSVQRLAAWLGSAFAAT